MIKLFNTNHPSVYLSLFGLSLVSRIALLVGPTLFLESSFTAVNTMSAFLSGRPVLLLVVESLIVVVNGVLINYLLILQEIVPRKTHLPAAILILSSAILLPGQGSISLQLAILFATISSIQLTTLTNKSNLVSGSFFSGVFIALASIVLPYVGILLVHSLLAIRMAKGSNLRMSLLQLLGFLVLIYFFWTGFFLFDHGLGFIENYLSGFRFSISSVFKNYEEIPKIGTAFTLFLVLIAGFTSLNHSIMRNVAPRGWMVYWMVMGIVFFLVGTLQENHIPAFSLSLIPLSAILTLFLLTERRKQLKGFLFLLFAAVAILQQVVIINPVGFFGSVW